MSKGYKRILLIKPGAIGDLLQLTPVIRALHRQYPGARLSLLVGSAGTASLFKHHPLVHESIVFDRKGEHRSLEKFIGLWQRLRAEDFDLVVNFQRSNIKAWGLVAATFPSKVLVYHKSRSHDIHAVRDHLKTLSSLGIEWEIAEDHLDLFWSDPEEAWANARLQGTDDGAPLVALNLGASHPVNRWPVTRFAELMQLVERELRAHILLVGGEQDLALADNLITQSTAKVINLVACTTLLQLGAVLRKCHVVVSGDTGPMHMATAVGTPVVALFGAADPGRTGPVGARNVVLQAKGVSCVPCRSRSCDNGEYQRCMTSISAQDVFDHIVGIMTSSRGTRE